MRFRARRNVDLPQPLGPMIAVTAFDATSIVTLSIARFSPYQIERASPSLPMPIIVGRDRIRKNLQWQRGDWLAEAVIPKMIAESGEKERSRFAANTSEGEKDPGNNPLGRSLHHDVDNCFPPA